MEEGGGDISLLEDIQTRSGAQPSPYSVGSVVPFGGKCSWKMM
jgi:hypothetical protein